MTAEIATDRAPRTIQVTVDGKAFAMPDVNLKKAAAWRARLMTAIGQVQLPDATSYTADWGTAVANAASEGMLELLLAFDETRALSLEKTAVAHRRSLQDRLTEQELLDAFIAVLRAVFPHIADPLAMVKQQLGDHLREQRGQRATAQIAELNRVATDFAAASAALTPPDSEGAPTA